MKLIRKCWFDWDIHQRRDAKRALKILKLGALTHVKRDLGKLDAKNAASAFEFGEYLTDNIASWVKGGVVAGPFKKPPLRKFRVNPLMAVHQKNKVRPILNLSSPKGSSFNDAVDPLRLKKLKMSSARMFADAITQAGRNAVFAKYDIRDAYKLIAGHKSQWRFFGFKWLGRYFFDTTTVFGSKSAPANFDYLPETIVNIVSTLSCVPKKHVFRQLDDVPIVSSERSGLTAKFAKKYVEVCQKINVPLAELCNDREKAFNPGKTGTVLGIFFDSEKMIWKLPAGKAEKILREIEKFSSQRSCTLADAQKLHGLLNDVSLMLDFAKGFRFEIIQLLGKFANDPDGRRLVTANLKADLKTWASMVSTAVNGFPLAEISGRAPPNALKFVSDAAGAAIQWVDGRKFNNTVRDDRGVASIGFCGEEIIFAGGCKWPIELLTSKKDSNGVLMGFKSTMLEAIGLLVPFVSHPDLMRHRYVVLQVDNIAVVYAWEKRYCKNDAETSLLIRVLHILEAKLECKIHCEHLPRKSNHMAILADHLSRKSTTTKAEMDQIKHIEWKPLKGALLNWINDPILDWNLPVKICSEIKD